ncbi:hypothetical protein NMY22_g4480 [Coprinellus aureogranulatus]|nr:hypothetical protein NMY22_g4480 [Coprinellus aureogranulatus]
MEAEMDVACIAHPKRPHLNRALPTRALESSVDTKVTSSNTEAAFEGTDDGEREGGEDWVSLIWKDRPSRCSAIGGHTMCKKQAKAEDKATQQLSTASCLQQPSSSHNLNNLNPGDARFNGPSSDTERVSNAAVRGRGSTAVKPYKELGAFEGRILALADVGRRCKDIGIGGAFSDIENVTEDRDE